MSQTPYALDLNIEEIVLHGFPTGMADRYLIAAAVEQELVRLFGEQGLPATIHQGAEVARVNGQPFEVTPGAKADSIGAQVAQAVYGGLAK